MEKRKEKNYIEINRKIRDLVDWFKDGNRDISFAKEFDYVDLLMGDEEILMQILWELLNITIKALKAGEELLIKSIKDIDNIIIHIETKESTHNMNNLENIRGIIKNEFNGSLERELTPDQGDILIIKLPTNYR